MKKTWDNLGRRERLAILGGAGIVALILLIQFAILPFWEEKARVAKALDTQEKVLEEMNTQLAEYRLIKRDMDVIRQALASRPADFTLFGFVER